jgi:hypothetical protein
MNQDEILRKLKELEGALSPEEKLKLLKELNVIVGELNGSIGEFNKAVGEEEKIADTRTVADAMYDK